MEVSGPMGPAVRADAAAAIGRTSLPARRYPREATLLVGTLLLAALLAVVPSPERSGARGDRALEEVASEESRKLESLSNVDVRFQELKEEAVRALKENRPEQALALLEELRRKLAEHMLEENGPQAAQEQAALDQIASTSAAVSRELARLGRVVHAPPPAVAQAKLERQKSVPALPATPAAPTLAAPATGTAVAQEIPWSPRYESVVRKYRGY